MSPILYHIILLVIMIRNHLRLKQSDRFTSESTCIPLSRVSFRVFVVQTGALGLKGCTAAEVLSGHIRIQDPETHIIFAPYAHIFSSLDSKLISLSR